MRVSILSILFTGLLCQICFAQKDKVYPTQMLTSALEMDGDFSEPAWQAVDWSGDFTQVDPENGRPPTFQTQFKILFDKDYLYVAIRAFDDKPDEIVSLPTARDFFDGDYVEINIDSDLDRKDAFSFTATAAGIRGDEHIQTADNWINDWNPHWEVKTAIHETGWDTEMKIPMRELELFTGAETWGIQVNRYIERLDELSSWSAVPDEDRWTEYFGTLKGLEGVPVQKPVSTLDVLPAGQLIADFQALYRTLQESYPSLYRYRSPAFVTSFYDRIMNEFQEGMTLSEYYTAISAFVSMIGDGHMRVGFPGQFQAAFLSQLKRLPFDMEIAGNDVFVTITYLDAVEQLRNARLTAINGRPIDELIHELACVIPSDGYNTTGKYHQLSRNFDFYYELVFGHGETAVIDFISFDKAEPSSILVELISGEAIADIQAKQPPVPSQEAFSFQMMDDIGVLRISTFNDYGDFEGFIDESFQEIADRKLKELIIDLRANGGGEETNAIYLYAHLADAPFKYYDRYEVKTPTGRASEQGVSLISYETMNYLASGTAGGGSQPQIITDIAASNGRLIDPNELQMPVAENRFSGEVIVLIDGGSFSATSEVCAIMARDERVTFVGTETGGAIDGNTSGLYEQITLPNSRLKIKVPLIKYVSAIDGLHDRLGHGVMPDLTVYPRRDADGKTIDRPLQFSIEMLKARR